MTFRSPSGTSPRPSLPLRMRLMRDGMSYSTNYSLNYASACSGEGGAGGAAAACGGEEEQEGSPLCSRAFEPRKGTDVAWGEYAGGRRQHRVVRRKEDTWPLCESRGRVFGGLLDGSLLEWDASTVEELHGLRCGGQVWAVSCMAACGDLLI